ncbi:hypothetical protein FDECE_834 [Fusarium decemcellulare]|nr:hypothetical protein FDECE_834 [Fusarium decemcellulare]
MGINNTVETRDHPESQSHIEAEEKRRTWWAAILLDRARLLLHDEERYPKHKFTNIADLFTLRNIEGEIAAHMLRLASSLSATGRCGAEETSPFCMDAMYRSGIVHARRYKEAQLQEDLHAFETIKAGLKVISGRWKAADSYVGMLDAREITGIL